MKQNIFFLLSLCIVLFSCSGDSDDPIKEVEKPPVETTDSFITLKKSNVDFTNEGGSEAISIESNVTWTAKSSEGWCTVSPTSGNKSTESIKISAEENETYDDRSCTVTIEGEGITKTITVNQGENLGLLVAQDRYELSNDGGTIEVEVKTNVEFEVKINDEWITQVETRGLTTTELSFNIAENDTYGNREGSITIKQKDGDMESTITIFQSQEDALILSEKDFEITSEAQSVEVELKTNIDYEIIIPEDAKDWVTHATTRALRTETVVLDIAENTDYDERSVKVIVKDKKTNLQETVTIKQAANTGLIVSDERYELSNEGGPIELEIKTNIDYEIIIPEAAKSWVSYIETRAFREETVVLYIDENKSEKMRSTNVYIKGKATDLQETITIYQIGNVPGVYWVDKMGALGTFLNQTQKDTITTMIIKGEINKTDFDVIKSKIPNLKYVNLKEVKCEGDKIPDYAFGGNSGANKNINTIILPESITVIGHGAFEDCTGLTGNLVIPDGVITIGDRAFDNCSGFTGNLILPDRLKTIGNRAFYGCSDFTGDLIFPDEVTTIGEYAFYGCLGFTGNLFLPDGITTIEGGAFQLCRGFTGDLNIPDKVITIERSAFYYCTGFTTLTIGENVTTIYESAFKDCWSITGNVVFPASLTSVRASGFEECNNVDAFRFPHTTPIAYYPKMFKDGATVEVPISAVNTYKSTNGWKDYNILGYIPIDGDLPIFE